MLSSSSFPGRKRLVAIGRHASWVPKTIMSWSMLSFWNISSNTYGVLGQPPAILKVTLRILISFGYRF